MAKGSHRRPDKRKKIAKRNVRSSDEIKDFQRIKKREKQSRKSKSLLRQMRGQRWDEEEYADELESQLEDN